MLEDGMIACGMAISLNRSTKFPLLTVNCSLFLIN